MLILILSVLFPLFVSTADTLVTVKISPLTADYNIDGKIVYAASFDIKDNWYIYWINPGDAGMETNISILNGDEEIPVDVFFPFPAKYESEGLASYGFKGKPNFFFSLPDNFRATYPLKFKVSWLACKDVCIPGNEVVQLEYLDMIEPDENTINYYFNIPKENGFLRVSHKLSNQSLIVNISSNNPGNSYNFDEVLVYPVTGGMVETTGENYTYSGTSATVTFNLDSFRDTSINDLTLAIYNPNGWGKSDVKNIYHTINLKE